MNQLRMHNMKPSLDALMGRFLDSHGSKQAAVQRGAHLAGIERRPARNHALRQQQEERVLQSQKGGPAADFPLWNSARGRHLQRPSEAH